MGPGLFEGYLIHPSQQHTVSKMDSSSNYSVKIIAIRSALTEMTQQARNTFNYWNIKIKSPS